MRRSVRLLTLLVLALSPARSPAQATPASPPPDPASVLMEADRAFARATLERGLEGWMSFFAEDAVRFGGSDPAVKGTAAIRAYDSELLFSDSTVTLHWEPTEAGLYRGGELGYTRGRSEARQKQPGGEARIVYRGTYLTLWRREPDGRWKVIMDTGAAAPE